MNHESIIARLTDTCRRCEIDELMSLQAELQAASDNDVLNICKCWLKAKSGQTAAVYADLDHLSLAAAGTE